MKKKRMGVLAASLALTGAMAGPYNVFAAASPNNFGIVYANGAPLSDQNVTIDATKVNNLATIIENKSEIKNIQGTWHEGYIKSSEFDVCRQFRYLDVTQSGIPSGNGHGFTIKSGEYEVTVQLERVNVEGLDPSGLKTTIGFVPSETAADAPKGISAFYGGWVPYSDSSCTTPESGYTKLSHTAGDGLGTGKIFAETYMKLKKNGQAFSSNELYLGIIDIDASQSYMIRNTSDEFTKDRLFATSTNALQPWFGDEQNVHNMYVGSVSGYPSYIYSEGHFNVSMNTKVYAKISEATQKSTNGLDFVFGFANAAGSEIEFYLTKYKVTYETTEGGKVSGGTLETVIAGNKPAGAVTPQADTGYVFDGWTTDQDVTLGDGTVIKKDGVITIEQVKTIVVNDNYNFIAHFSPKQDQSKSYVVEYVADEGGSIDGTTREDVDEGKNPSGSSAKADEGYEFDGWTTDQDVTLDDGTTVIKKGEVITDEQIKHVVVDKNMQFTAHFKKKAGSPDTGAFSGDIGAVTIATASTLGLLLVAVAIKVLPQITRRRVKFD